MNKKLGGPRDKSVWAETSVGCTPPQVPLCSASASCPRGPWGFLGPGNLVYPCKPSTTHSSALTQWVNCERTVRFGAHVAGRATEVGKGPEAGTDPVCRGSNAIGGWIKGSEARFKDLDPIIVPGQLLGPVLRPVLRPVLGP